MLLLPPKDENWCFVSLSVKISSISDGLLGTFHSQIPVYLLYTILATTANYTCMFIVTLLATYQKNKNEKQDRLSLISVVE